MTTVVSIIGDSLREINVISEDEAPSAEQGSFALRRLNQMLEAWTEDDIELGYFKQSATTATIPIPEWSELAVIKMLSINLAPNYGASVSAELVNTASDAYGMLLRKSIAEKQRGGNMDTMPQGEGKYRPEGRILTDV